ncbi:transglutaminase domain-containing protein [Demequina iriomotensis]|uniref:transglutaminase domain-containing protein n=1 Tax=Demequina iriomotensis TaxID=1536641 RepID=UPI0007832097|nr:transglutaminase domain-containing protein [Demequina iriomotensis]
MVVTPERDPAPPQGWSAADAHARVNAAYARSRRAARRRRIAWTGTLVVLVTFLGVSVAGQLGILPESANLAARAAAAMTPSGRPESAHVAYPVNGSTDLVRHLAAGMVAQDGTIDVTYWARADGDDAVEDAMREALSQNPYVFVQGWTTARSLARVTVQPGYVYDDAEADRRRVATATAVQHAIAVSGAATATTEARQVTAIHDYLASSASYDKAAFEAITRGEVDSALVARSQEAYGILVDGTAVCTGYAQAFLAMAHAVGLEAVEVTGSDSAGLTGGDHAWNKVRVDGRWMLVDVTWDDIDGPRRPRHDYLLIEDGDPLLSTRTTDDEWMVDAHLGGYAS